MKYLLIADIELDINSEYSELVQNILISQTDANSEEEAWKNLSKTILIDRDGKSKEYYIDLHWAKKNIKSNIFEIYSRLVQV